MCGRITVEEIKAVETLWLFDTHIEAFQKFGEFSEDRTEFRSLCG